MARLGTWLLFCLAALSLANWDLRAQDKVLEVDHRIFNGEFIGPYLSMRWGTPEEKVDDAAKATDYVANQEPVARLGITPGNSVGWARFTTRNKSDRTVTVLVQNGMPSRLMSFFYRDSSGLWMEQSLGRERGLYNSPIQYRNATFELEIPPGDTTWYVRHFYAAQSFSLAMYTPKEFTNDKLGEYALLGGYFMTLVVMIFYNLMLFTIFRYRYYLLYILHLSCYILMEASLLGFPLQYFPKFMQEIGNHNGFWFGLSVMSSVLFGRSFLETAAMTPRIDRFLKFIVFSCVVHSTLVLFTLKFYTFTMVPCMLGPVAMLATAIYRSVHGYRPARFYILGWSAFITGSLLGFAAYLFGFNAGGFFTSWASRFSAILEVMLFSLALANKVHEKEVDANRRIGNLNEQLRYHISNVEAIVEEKARKIRSILNNIKMGVFTVGGDGRIDQEYSAHLEEMLGQKDLEGQRVLPLLLERSTMTTDERSQFESALVSSLGEDEIGFELNQSLFPREIQHLDKNGQRSILESEWIPMISDEGATGKLLVVLRDVTETRKLVLQKEEQEQKLRQISELISISDGDFRRFQKQTESCVRACEMRIPEITRGPGEALQDVFIRVHTLKGLSRNLGLRSMSDALHRLESTLMMVRDQNTEADHALLLQQLLLVANLKHSYVNLQKSILLRAMADEEGLDSGLRLHSDLQYTLGRLASMLSKVEPLLQFEARASFELGEDEEDQLRAVFMHLLGNCMDHGIENPSERERLGKAEKGTVRVHMDYREGVLHGEVQDDGRGLDLEAILHKARVMGASTPSSLESPDQIAQLILHPGLSTATQVSEISGRGVGMDAVRQILEESGGGIEVVLLEDRGPFSRSPFLIRFWLPLKAAAKRGIA